MAQGNNKKRLNKHVKKGDKGFPIATIAYYGPTDVIASKVVVAIFAYQDADPEPMKKWVSTSDVRKSEKILGELLDFLKENDVKTVSLIDTIFGCPHEAGIDYPRGGYCPECKYWIGRDRLSHELIH
ncbi:MAG: hypothetical protein HRT37_08230 [Alteromonadaceae bacterium]|nr:hypothetical protein [Alteromonadaceae bacterium]